MSGDNAIIPRAAPRYQRHRSKTVLAAVMDRVALSMEENPQLERRIIGQRAIRLSGATRSGVETP